MFAWLLGRANATKLIVSYIGCACALTLIGLRLGREGREE